MRKWLLLGALVLVLAAVVTSAGSPPVWVVPSSRLDGVTGCDAHGTPTVWINARVVVGPAWRLRETLAHEVYHYRHFRAWGCKGMQHRLAVDSLEYREEIGAWCAGVNEVAGDPDAPARMWLVEDAKETLTLYGFSETEARLRADVERECGS